jgi:hypothetical protein
MKLLDIIKEIKIKRKPNVWQWEELTKAKFNLIQIGDIINVDEGEPGQYEVDEFDKESYGDEIWYKVLRTHRIDIEYDEDEEDEYYKEFSEYNFS